MQAAMIRDKYKRILEEPEEEDSEEEWEQAYAQMAKHRKQRIHTDQRALTDSNCQNNNENADAPQTVLAIKQKLAQCLANCQQHTKEIDRFKKEQTLFAEERREWREREEELLKATDDQKAAAAALLERTKQLQMELQDVQLKCQEIAMERELQQKQSQYYKSELAQLREEVEKKDRQFRQCEKEFRAFEKVKKENEYLKGDVERLSSLIEDSVRFGKISSEIMRKHFLGKPHREMEFWYPQQLVAEVQHFLKKSQVGHGNKEFTANLVKFIEKVGQKATKDEGRSKQSASLCKQKEKDCQSLKKATKLNIFELSNKKHSCNIGSMREQYLLKSNTNSFWKSNESRVVGNSTTFNMVSIKSQCWDVINEFRTIVFELLLEKEVKRKKLKRLLDSMINTVMELFENSAIAKQFNFNIERKDDLGGMRIMTEDNSSSK